MKVWKYKKHVCAVLGIMFLTGCSAVQSGQEDAAVQNETEQKGKNAAIREEYMITDAKIIVPEESIQELEEGLSVVRFDGNDGFTGFLENGGAESDQEVVAYLAENMIQGAAELIFDGTPFGCSTISTTSADGEMFFGRNFDWHNCNALIVASYPENAYASVSTVNTDFITQGAGSLSAVMSSDKIMKLAALYAPVDGMNEQGLCISVNMIQDSDTIEQNTEKPDITTTTAVRLLLNQAADVKEAVELLQKHDMHASFGLMIHFAIADAKGNSVVAEYVNNELVITETPVVTNYYLSEGGKNGIGTSQSHERYNTLMQALKEQEHMAEVQVRDALESVSKHHYSDGETTEWSAIFNQSVGEAVYYHRENFNNAYRISLD